MRRVRLSVGALLAVVLVLLGAAPAQADHAIRPGHLAYPRGGTIAIGPGTDAANQNAQLAENLPAGLKASWRAQPKLGSSAANSDGHSISVTAQVTVVVDRQYQRSFVSAYATSSGKLLWRRQYHFAYRAIVDGSTVYVSHDNQVTMDDEVDALRLGDGKLLWQRFAGIMLYAGYVPAVGAGRVVGSVWAVDAATGKPRFTLPNDDTTTEQASSLVVGDRIYLNSGSGVAAYSARTGAKLWGYRKESWGPGSGNDRPSVHAGRVYLSGINRLTLVLDANSGAYVRTLPISERAIAFDGDVGIFTVLDDLVSSRVSAVNLMTGHTYWTHRFVPGGAPGAMPRPTVVTAPPLVTNSLVWVQSGQTSNTPAVLTALDEVTGRVRSRTTQACPPAVDWDRGTIVAAQHRLFTSSSCGVLTYVK